MFDDDADNAAANNTTADNDGQWRSHPPQFGLRDMMLATLIASIMALTYAGLLRQGPQWPVYVLLACMAPLILVVAAALAQGGLRWWLRRQRRVELDETTAH